MVSTDCEVCLRLPPDQYGVRSSLSRRRDPRPVDDPRKAISCTIGSFGLDYIGPETAPAKFGWDGEESETIPGTLAR